MRRNGLSRDCQRLVPPDGFEKAKPDVEIAADMMATGRFLRYSSVG